jgi:membrane protease subunit (stomatin/prohibitin family)
MMVPIRAFGQYGVQIKDSKKFLLKLVGTLKSFNSEALSKYFAGVFGTRIKQAIAEAIIERKISVLETSMHLEEISAILQSSLEIDMNEYGIRLTNFNIRSINLPENDPAVIQLKSALAKKAELGILGMSYQQDRSFNVLQTAAGNEGTAGNMVGTGLGLGIGVGIGGGAAQALTNNIGTEENGSMQNLDYSERIRLLKEAGEMRESGILNEEEFSLFKAQILRENR